MTITVTVILALVVVQRLVELAYAERNTRALLKRGAVEVGRAHYPFIVALHALWLLAIVIMLPPNPMIRWSPLALFLMLQAGRIWVIATLGPYWTTRIITLAGAPLVRSGPYRFVRHPNYLIVAGEIAVLPLVFGELAVCLVFSVLNAALLLWRIRQEDAALSLRRTGDTGITSMG
jgi:methyltransferase